MHDHRLHLVPAALLALALGAGQPAAQTPRAPGAARRAGRPAPSPAPAGRLPTALVSDFEIAPQRDQASVALQIGGPGLYSAEISFECRDSRRTHDRVALGVRSWPQPGRTETAPGRPLRWFGAERTLEPGTSYRFSFWVDAGMLARLDASRTLSFVFTRKDTARLVVESTVDEFAPQQRTAITLPRIVGRVHFRTPAPIAASASAGGRALPVTLDAGTVVQYRVQVDFPRPGPRSRPTALACAFRLPLLEGRRNADVGGVLLRDGRRVTASQVTQSGAYEFVTSPSLEFSRDVNGRKRLPTLEDWTKFKANGLFAAIDGFQAITAEASFALTGGDTPPEYFVAELEKIELSAVPDEGDGPLRLHVRSAAVAAAEEEAQGVTPDDLPADAVAQQLDATVMVPHAGASAGTVLAHLPLLVLPDTALARQSSLAIAADPHYFHEMGVLEQVDYMLFDTGLFAMIKAVWEKDPKAFVENLITFVGESSKQRAKDPYRSFGVNAFQSTSPQGWGLEGHRQPYSLTSGSASLTDLVDVQATSGEPRAVALATALRPGANSGRSHTATLRVRKVPGVFVDGASVRVTGLKLNHDFNGHLSVCVGILGGEGGRLRSSGQGLNMESAAVGTPYAFWANRIRERGPYRLRAGARQAIQFDAVDFTHPDRDVEGLWEQLSHTYGAWAGLRLRITLDRQPGRTVSVADQGVAMIYPYDYLLGERAAAARRDGDWVVIREWFPVHGDVLDEVELEVRLRATARRFAPTMFRATTARPQGSGQR
ncbi:MAG: hypothetical protein HZC42_12565 [Candidatus Eisenbacteria bacterium]|nr:hypothetical protein [Candidatus Eisenbacteria bacterium]